MNIAKFYDVIKNNESFLVTSHIVPDGDSIGSTLALTLALLKIGKKAVPVINDKIPKKYLYLPGSDFIKEEIRGKYDVIIALDCGDIGRLGFEKELKEYGNIVVNIDHHKSNTYFGDLNIVDSKASSVGEIVYRLLDGKIEIDYDISINLFTSIITDTGSIRYGNTTSSSLIILAKLIDNGVKPEYVSRQIYENRSLSSIILLKLVLDTLKISSDGKLASLYITNEMMEISGASEEDTEGIINYAREIEGVKVAVLFKENKGPMIKVGLRSNKSIDVSKIAEEFKGGGHENAAGCNVKQPLNKARNIILNKIKEHMMGESCERRN